MRISRFLNGLAGLGVFALAGWTWAHSDDEAAKLNAGLDKAKVTLAKAAEAAEKKLPNAKALEVGLSFAAKEPQYGVLMLDGNEFQRVSVDGTSGEAKEAPRKRPAKEKPDLAQVKTTLSQAIEAAVKAAGGGKAFHAKLEMEGKKLIYRVHLSDGDELKEAQVDPATGKVSTTLGEDEIDPTQMDHITDIIAGKRPQRGGPNANKPGDSK